MHELNIVHHHKIKIYLLTMETDPLLQGIHEFWNTYLHIVADESTKHMYSEWTRVPTGEEYKKASVILIDWICNKEINYWIQDTNNLKEVAFEDQEWVLRAIASNTLTSKLSKIACICSYDDTTRIDLAKKVNQEHNKNIAIQQFETFREAAFWIWDAAI